MSVRLKIIINILNGHPFLDTWGENENRNYKEAEDESTHDDHPGAHIASSSNERKLTTTVIIVEVNAVEGNWDVYGFLVDLSWILIDVRCET